MTSSDPYALDLYNMTVRAQYKYYPEVVTEKVFTVEIYKDCALSTIQIDNTTFSQNFTKDFRDTHDSKEMSWTDAVLTADDPKWLCGEF